MTDGTPTTRIGAVTMPTEREACIELLKKISKDARTAASELQSIRSTTENGEIQHFAERYEDSLWKISNNSENLWEALSQKSAESDLIAESSILRGFLARSLENLPRIDDQSIKWMEQVEPENFNRAQKAAGLINAVRDALPTVLASLNSPATKGRG